MTVCEKAYAKINLHLDVLGRYNNGFHDILSVMESVSLCDTLEISVSEYDTLVVAISCNDHNLPLDNSNLIGISAIKYLSKFGIKANVDVKLNKLIPIGAGLGGGSSDAAATLRALNKIYGLASEEELLQMAAEIGSDVSFCLVGGRALCTGRGEKVEAVPNYPISHYVIAIGEGRVSTPVAFRALDEKYNFFVDGARSVIHPQILHYNIFENVIHSDEIDKIKKILMSNGAEYSLMSGSGPSVFGEFTDEQQARETVDNLKRQGFSAYYCHTIRGEL